MGTDNGNRYAESPIAILFGEPQINLLFSELLKARGLRTQIITDASILEPSVKVITEPQFFESLGQENKKRCLVVGNKDALRAVDALSLSRPLTEAKIEAALSRFLA
ncbi:MAG: hypothetical protein J5J00_03720 [Deltaproteobacteria bacterium]|nr:hypothetical protein [Deltaproteobacteria bacterium]